jgi:hypothetical protein
MTELKLCRFITDHNIEYTWHNTDVLMFVPYWKISYFREILSSTLFDDGVDCVMKDGYFGFNMRDICEYYGVELENVFQKETK